MIEADGRVVEWALSQSQAYKDRLLIQLLGLAIESCGDVGFWEGDEDDEEPYIYCLHSGERYGNEK